MVPAVIEQGLCATLQTKRLWIRRLANAIVRKFAGRRPSANNLARFILKQWAFQVAFQSGAIPRLTELGHKAEMVPAPNGWPVKPINNLAALAQWLNLTASELDWFSDRRSLERGVEGKLLHYHRHWERKRSGNHRLIESPKQRLKAIQRAILREILEPIPPHAAAHGFRRGRSILSFASPHTGQAIVLKMDLKDFFPTYSRARIENIFLTAGYPPNVAEALAGICTTICPPNLLADLPSEYRREARRLYVRKHLPQGAPTSPMLANLGAFKLDGRLAGLARAAGANYTRYADDLVFSGGTKFARSVNRLLIHVMAIALEEGFAANPRKTRVMRQGVSQRAAGLVLNAKPNFPRAEFDRLKAILTNCARRGSAGQNHDQHPDFAAHLAGKISHVKMINSTKGAKLKRIFAAIDWST